MGAAQLVQLEALNLNYTPVTDAGLALLSKHTDFTDLRLDRTDLTDKSATWLASQKNLKYLDLYHTQLSEQGFNGLRKALPKLYSVASSKKSHPDQVHLLVVSVRYRIRGRERLGPCSTWLADRWPVGATADMYLQDQQRHFAMPADPDRPMIMVGPGTGLAPFRAFIEERRATGATGRNWLFFGEQRRSTNFFYEQEWMAYSRDGFLRMDLAFSRDQADKVYVQHRMREQARDVWAWLEEGAEFFVCGDKERMAADVDRELHQIAETAGGRTPDQAREYVEDLRRTKRYKRDVY